MYVESDFHCIVNILRTIKTINITRIYWLHCLLSQEAHAYAVFVCVIFEFGKPLI